MATNGNKKLRYREEHSASVLMYFDISLERICLSNYFYIMGPERRVGKVPIIQYELLWTVTVVVQRGD